MKNENKPKFKPDHLQRFEEHLKQIEISKTDDFVISSIKLTFFAGWAAAMDSLSQGWFESRAQSVKEELEQALEKLQGIEAAKNAPQPDNVIDFSFDEEEKVGVSYVDFKVD